MNIYGAEDNTTWPMLITPSDGEYAIRYLWFKYKPKNEEFLANYFSGDSLGLNMRALSVDLREYWAPHNAAIEQAVRNKELIWRIKLLNANNQSIDHIEVWRNGDVLSRYIDDELVLENGMTWTEESKSLLGKGLRDRGFEIRRTVNPYPTISEADSTESFFQLKNLPNSFVQSTQLSR